MLMVSFSVVADDFHSSNHRPDREETQDLRSNDTDCSHLFPADVTDAAKDGLRRGAGSHGACAGHDGSRVLSCFDDGLEVGLKLGDGAS